MTSLYNLLKSTRRTSPHKSTVPPNLRAAQARSVQSTRRTSLQPPARAHLNRSSTAQRRVLKHRPAQRHFNTLGGWAVVYTVHLQYTLYLDGTAYISTGPT